MTTSVGRSGALTPLLRVATGAFSRERERGYHQSRRTRRGQAGTYLAVLVQVDIEYRERLEGWGEPIVYPAYSLWSPSGENHVFGGHGRVQGREYDRCARDQRKQ